MSSGADTTTTAPADAPLATLAAAEEAIADTNVPATHVPVDAGADTPVVTPIAAASANTAEEDDVMDNTNPAEAVQAKATEMFADAKTRTEDAMARSARMFEQMNALAKGNVEAMVEASRIAARGFEAMSQDAAENARKALEGMTAAAKTLGSTKSPTEVVKLQGDLARSAFDALVAETSRTTEAMLKLAGDVAQPLSNRLAVAMDTAKSA